MHPVDGGFFASDNMVEFNVIANSDCGNCRMEDLIVTIVCIARLFLCIWEGRLARLIIIIDSAIYGQQTIFD